MSPASETLRAATDQLLRDAEAIFPLPLTPFELFMLTESFLGNDMSFLIWLDTEGDIDRNALNEAGRHTAARHPHTRANVERSRIRGWQWKLDAEIWPTVSWTEDCFAPKPPANLKRECGLRIRIAERSQTATILFQFHHACCDGVGAFQWIGDFLAAYAAIQSGTPQADLAALDHTRLVDRGKLRFRKFRGRSWWKQYFQDIYHFWFFPPQPLAPANADAMAASSTSAAHPIALHRFSCEATSRLRQAAVAARVTLNDLLICNLFMTIARWNSEHQLARDGWYRINMPTSLRERADSATPAANIMSMTFLKRRHSAVVLDREKLLQDIRLESEQIKRERRGSMFLEEIAHGAAVPGLLSTALRVPLCMSTAVLTNVGDPCRRFTCRLPRRGHELVCGNLLVRGMAGVPPLRPRTHIALGILTYAGQLGLTLLLSPGIFTRTHSEEFLQRFINQLHEFASID
jgi:hypothetical protein